jgi:uncharacterized membrane protein
VNTENKKARVVTVIAVVGFFLVFLWLKMVPALKGQQSVVWSATDPLISGIGALVIVLAIVVAWRWNPEPSKRR